MSPSVPFVPLLPENFGRPEITRNIRDCAEKALARRVDPIREPAAEYQEAYQNFRVYTKMLKSLSKISKSVREDQNATKSLDKLEKQLKDGEFAGDRGAKKIKGTKTVFELRSGGTSRLYIRYPKEEKGAIEIIGESDKKSQKEVIKILKKNYD